MRDVFTGLHHSFHKLTLDEIVCQMTPRKWSLFSFCTSFRSLFWLLVLLPDMVPACQVLFKFAAHVAAGLCVSQQDVHLHRTFICCCTSSSFFNYASVICTTYPLQVTRKLEPIANDLRWEVHLGLTAFHTHIHSYGEFKVSRRSNQYVFGLFGNPGKKEGQLQQNILAMRPQC